MIPNDKNDFNIKIIFDNCSCGKYRQTLMFINVFYTMNIKTNRNKLHSIAHYWKPSIHEDIPLPVYHKTQSYKHRNKKYAFRPSEITEQHQH